jgi:hypothetical protein
MTWNDPAPGECEAGERSWSVVRSAWDSRVAHPRPRRRHRAVIAIAVGLAIIGAIISPPGLAVLGSIRDAVATKTTRDELTSLPSAGRLLVQTPAGPWVVQQNGEKRLLAGYGDTAWSPHGLYVAAARGNELVAMEPNGRIHWTLARGRPIGAPKWSFEGYRIAYLSGPALRVVNGDGTGDRLISRNIVGTGLPQYAWLAGTHELVYENLRHQAVVADVDRGRVLHRGRPTTFDRLLWSVAATTPPFTSKTLPLSPHIASGLPWQVAAFQPHGNALALVLASHGTSSVVVYRGSRRRVTFSGPGVFRGLAWSPDGHWLLVDWSTADEWVFIRSTRPRRVITVSNVNRIFRTSVEGPATLAGWCCP